MTPIIDIEHLTKIYQIGETQSYKTLRDSISGLFNKKTINNEKSRFIALDDINLQVNPGEVIGLIGKNGAGKSTLLKILSRITYPDQGKITLRGRVASLLEVGTGFSPELTGRENIFLNGTILGMNRKEILRKFDEIVDFSGVEEFIDTPVKRYSSGMYMRLAFAVAANLESEILLVDEVLAVGDAEFQKKCLTRMEKITQDEGRTIIFVSHNLLSVQKLCKTSVLLSEGKIITIGKTSQVIDDYLNSGSSSTSGEVNVALNGGIPNQGNIRVTNIKVSNISGTGEIKSNNKLRIILDYTSDLKNLITDSRIAITIVSAHSENIVLSFDSDICTDKIKKGILPTGQLICESDVINLVEGKYYVNIYFHIHGTRVDVVERACAFEVKTSVKDYGFINHPDKNVSDHIVKYSFKN